MYSVGSTNSLELNPPSPLLPILKGPFATADGQSILAGGIILRQRGTETHPGLNVKRAGDDSLFATADGIVSFSQKGKKRKIVNVLSSK